jgi:hypothetical protein
MKRMALPERDSTGKFPAYAWPGGYPLIYLCADGGILCPACANNANGSEAYAGDYVPERGRDWHMIGADVYWEGPPMQCDHCNKAIESAYGDPDAEQE